MSKIPDQRGKGFFRDVMKLKVKMKKKGRIEPLKPIQPKKKDKKMIRVFTGQRDMSQDTASKNKWIKANLEGLTSDELKRLRKKIAKIASCLHRDDDLSPDVNAHKDVIFEYVELKLAETEKNLEEIRAQVEKRLKKFPDLKPREITPNFVREHFNDLIEDYRKRVEKHLILPEIRDKSPTYFILRTIKRYL